MRPQHVRQLRAEALLREALGAPPKLVAIPIPGDQRTNAVPNLAWIARVRYQEPVAIGAHDVARSSRVARQDGRPGGQRLHHRDPEVLLAHVYEAAARGEQA